MRASALAELHPVRPVHGEPAGRRAGQGRAASSGRPIRPTAGPACSSSPREADAVLAEHDDIRLRHFATMLADWTERDLHRFAALLHRFTDGIRQRQRAAGSPSASRARDVSEQGRTPDGRHHGSARHAGRSGELSHRQIMTILSGLMLGMFLAALDQTIVVDGDPHDRRRPERPVRPGVGDDGVPDHLDDRDAAVRQAVRHLRPQAAVTCSRSSIFVLGSALCGLSHVDVHARRVPRVPGHRRRRPDVARAGDHRRHHPAARAREVPGLLHGRVRHVVGARPGGRRLPRRPDRACFGSAGWRWIFYINVPIGIARASSSSPACCMLEHYRRDHRIDWWGAVMLVVGLVPLLIIAEQGRVWGWSSAAALRLLRARRVRARRFRLGGRSDGRRGAAARCACSATGCSRSARRSRSSSASACSAAWSRSRCTCRSSRARRRPRQAC